MMTEPSDCVVDTSVLQKANAPIRHSPRKASDFVKRLRLLESIRDGRTRVLISKSLINEYRRQIREPRNDHVKAFLELLTGSTDRVRFNWKRRWSGADREKARRCRYPAEDDHVLRTAIQPQGSTILTEEHRMLTSDACIYRLFGVHIKGLS